MKTQRFVFILGVLAALGAGPPASAQYMKLVSDNPVDPTRLRSSGTTIVSVTLDTNHDRDGSLQTCNSHSAALCGGQATNEPLDIFSYTLALTAVGGTVTWGAFTAGDPAYADITPQISSASETEIYQARTEGTVTPAGLVTLGTISVTIASGSPAIRVQRGPGVLDPFGFGTGFGTTCTASNFANTYVLGDPADPCGTRSGLPGTWFDADGVDPPAQASTVRLSLLHEMDLIPGSALDQAFSATDTDGSAITFAITGPSFVTLTSDAQSGSARTGTIHVASPLGTAGTFAAAVTASANGASDTRTFVVRILGSPPALDQPVRMTVDAGSAADQRLSASDPDAEPLTFSLVSGPSFASVTTSDAGHGVATGNLHLAPGDADVGTADVAVGVTDGSFLVSKSLAVTVNPRGTTPPPQNPVVDPIGTLSVAEGDTLNFDVTAHDPGGQMMSFTFTGPAFMTLVVAPGCGTGQHATIHLAPAVGAAGSYAASVTATADTRTTTEEFTIVVSSKGGTASLPVQKGLRSSGRASPNPFNPSTTIGFELKTPGRVRLRIYDVAGHLVNPLMDRALGAGIQEVRWDGTGTDGTRLSSGVYFFVLETPDRTMREGVVLAR